MKKIRCAVYTRKSSEDGLEQEFNSLHAQRDACSAYIASQKHEGWVMLPNAYDDGGLSGGSLERPALQRLMEHVREGKVDQIVVWTAPIEWSGLIVSASSVFGPLERMFLVPAGGISASCAA